MSKHESNERTSDTSTNANTQLIGSLYDFSPEAKRDILSSLRTIARDDVGYDFEDESSDLTIVCPQDDETSVPAFINVIDAFIKKEIGHSNLDVFEEARVVRVPGTQITFERIKQPEDIVLPLEQENPASELRLIDHENITRVWTPSKEGRDLDVKINTSVLAKIGSLCQCRVEYMENAVDVVIKGDSEKDAEKAIAKLNVIDQTSQQRLKLPYDTSFCILEGELNVKLRLVPLKDLKDRRFMTTLMPPTSLMFTSLGNALVLCMVRQSDGSLIEIKQKRPRYSSINGLPWMEHSGATDENFPTWLDHPSMAEKKGITYQWVDETRAVQSKMDAFEPLPEFGEQMKIDTAPPPKSPPKKPSTRKVRVPKGKKSEPLMVAAGASENPVTARGNTSSHGSSHQEQSSRLFLPPEIKPPYIPKATLTPPKATAAAGESNTAGWEAKNKYGSRTGKLIDISSPIEDRLQESGPTKPDLRRTMGQKKAAGQKITGGTSGILKSFEDAATQILTHIPSLPGPAEFELAIGRLLVDSQAGPSEFKKRSFDVSEWSSAFPPAHGVSAGLSTVFTPRLTTNPSDIESIIKIRLSQGRPLFEESSQHKMFYIISCTTKSKEQLIIELEEDGSFHIYGPNVSIEGLDLCFPKRSWDARLSLRSYDFLVGSYLEQVQAIVNNLRISPSATPYHKGIDISTQTMDQELTINSIVSHRESAYEATTFPDLLLHIIQVEDYSVWQPAGSGNKYYGSSTTPKTMVDKGKLWFEAKITSVTATNELQGNEDLELGEPATWNSRSVIEKGVVRDLFYIADEIVTRIDDVGYFNQGLKSETASVSEAPQLHGAPW